MNRIPAALDTSRLRNLMTSRRLILTLLAVVTGALLLAPVASADLWSPESGGSSNADDIDTLYKFVFAVAIVVFVGVEGVLLYSVFKFKAKKGRVAAQIRGNTRLEIGWTVGAALILVVLAVLTFVKLDDIRNPPDSSPNGLQLADTSRRLPPNGKSLNICVNGQQYIWRFTYSDNCKAGANLGEPFSYEEMVVPVDTTVTLDINAQDVAHSWWIPKLGGKFDADPRLHQPHLVQGPRQVRDQAGRDRLLRPVRRAVRAQPREHDRPRARRVRRRVPALAQRPQGRHQVRREAGR